MSINDYSLEIQFLLISVSSKTYEIRLEIPVGDNIIIRVKKIENNQ